MGLEYNFYTYRFHFHSFWRGTSFAVVVVGVVDALLDSRPLDVDGAIDG